MSNLKYQSLEELLNSRKNCEKYISLISSKLSGQRERLKWIDYYIQQKQTNKIGK